MRKDCGRDSAVSNREHGLGMGAGIVVIGLALRVAAKVRAPLICKMPILSGMANSKKPATRLEMMLAGLAFATGCMTCVGSALVGPGDETVLSDMEHHSNIVPWQILAGEKGARVRAIPMFDTGELRLDEYERLLNDRTRVVPTR